MANGQVVFVNGRLVSDPVTKDFNETSKTTFRVAVNQRLLKEKDANGYRQYKVWWLDVEVWNGLGKTIEQYAKKGDEITLKGSCYTDSWEDKNGGGTRSRVIMTADEMWFGGKGKGEVDGGSNSAGESNTVETKKKAGRPKKDVAPAKTPPTPNNDVDSDAEVGDDEIPF